MRRVKNLIENKDLINTFKKFKSKLHHNKRFFKNSLFYTSKYNRVVFLKYNIYLESNKFKFIFFKKFFLKNFNLNTEITYLNKLPIETIIMFIN